MSATAVETLEALWVALSENYPMLEYAGAHGDGWREEFRPRVAAAPTAEAAWGLMDELVCRLNDYHTRFLPPDPPPTALPPITLGLARRGPADDLRLFQPFPAFVAAPADPPPLAPYVLAVLAVCGAGEATGLRPGEEVVSVDATPLVISLDRAWKHAVGSSPAAKLREAAQWMLRGAPGTPVVLGVRSQDGGEVRTVTLTRAALLDEPAVSAREVGGVPVVRIARWWQRDDEDLAATVDGMLEEYHDRPGLVFDVRGNGGGADTLADQVTGRFLERPAVSSISFHRQAPGLTYERTVEWAQPRGPWRYAGRVAVLTDAGCRSACEHFVSGMAEAGALLCGTPTDGACGWMRAVALPGGAQVIVSRTFPLHTGGLPSPLLGIAPHLWRPPTVAGLRAGVDTALAAALAWVGSGEPRPPRRCAL